MRIFVDTIKYFPDTKQGRRMAQELEDKLKAQGSFKARKEQRGYVVIFEACWVTVKDEEGEE